MFFISVSLCFSVISIMSRAENGCFIKTIKARSSTSPHGDWINMVASFNLTWKSACLEILNYVCHPLPIIHTLTQPSYSLQNGHPVHSSKNARHQWSGASGQARAPIANVQTANGPVVKLPKPRTTSSTGK